VLAALTTPVATPTTTAAAVKLPKLEVQRFSGRTAEWVEFKSQYSSSIHQHPALDDGQRMRYLSMLLIGEPSHLIRQLQVTASNYQEAWRIVCEHYDNPMLLLQTHVESLLMLPSPKHGESSLRDLYSGCKQHLAGIRTLERENPSIDSAATAYIYMMLSKCLSNVRVEHHGERREPNTHR